MSKDDNSCNTGVNSDLVQDIGESVQLGQLHQIEPRHVSNPLRRLWRHCIQIEGSATYDPPQKHTSLTKRVGLSGRVSD